VERVRAERADGNSGELLLAQPEVERPGSRPNAPGGEKRHALVAKAPEGEAQRVAGRGIEPLDVVNGKHQRRVVTRGSDQGKRGGAHRSRVHRRGVGRGAQQGHIQRLALRRRHLLGGRVDNGAEQVGQRRMR
jgi:hypothetical protein